MRNAPSVMFPVGRSFFYGFLLVVLAVLSLAVWLAWWSSGWADAAAVRTTMTGTAEPAWLVLWLMWCVFALFSWRRSPTGVLQWDAQGLLNEQDNKTSSAGVWRWRSAAYRDGTPLQRVRCVLDLQNRALLQLRNIDGVHSWVWVERRNEPSRWLDLRRAWLATQA